MQDAKGGFERSDYCIALSSIDFYKQPACWSQQPTDAAAISLPHPFFLQQRIASPVGDQIVWSLQNGRQDIVRDEFDVSGIARFDGRYPGGIHARGGNVGRRHFESEPGKAPRLRSKPCADVEEPSALDSKKLKRLGEVGV